jgi:curved DNA-binding protein CbpA/predicted TPR repeat methyltransferase
MSRAPSSPPPHDGGAFSEEDRARVDALYLELDTLDHYGVLGLTPAAKRKEIKAAYYGLAAFFHPDRHFRKDLGPYRQRLEACFRRITEAHDVLTSKARAAYDAAHAADPARASHTRSAAPSSPSDDVAELEALLTRAQSERASPAAKPVEPSSRSESPPPRRESPSSPAPTGVRMRHVTSTEPTPAQREAFARRLMGVRAPPTRSSTTLKAAVPTGARSNDAPEGSPLEVRALAARATEQERSGDFATAALTWQRAATLQPKDSTLWERAAKGALRAGRLPSVAFDAARKVVELNPYGAASWLLLAEAAHGAGQSALVDRALCEARRLAPSDAAAELLTKRLRPGA